MCEWLFSRPNCCYWRRRKGDLIKLKEEWNSKKLKWGWDSQIAYLNLPSRLWATQQPFEDSCITFADKVMFRCQCWFCIKSNTSPHFLTVVKGWTKHGEYRLKNGILHRHIQQCNQKWTLVKVCNASISLQPAWSLDFAAISWYVYDFAENMAWPNTTTQRDP